MKLSNILAHLSAITIANATSVSVAFDPRYDDGYSSTSVTSCSDGANGLMANYPTLGSMPGFPYIGAAITIPGWNAPDCGKCYSLTYNGKTIHVLAMDASSNGFVTSTAAFTALTGNKDLGRVTAEYAPADISMCNGS